MELRRKMMRDIKKNFFQFLSIFFIAALGVFAYSGLICVRQGLVESMERYCDETNMADIWLYVDSTTEEQLEQVKNIAGVEEVQARLSYTYKYDGKELELISSDKNKISTPYYMEGEEYSEDKGGIWLDRDFAAANEYEVGDSIEINGTDVEIKGIIMSAEKIYAPSTGEAVTDFNIYGYAYMSSQQFEKLFGMYTVNQIMVIKDEDTSVKNIISGVKEELGEHYYTYISGNAQSSINHINERIRQLTQFAYIFPALFYLLAVITMLTTMKRLVDKQKVQIGALMSMGYSNGQILRHYISFGIWIGLFGGITGAVTGYFIIPDVLIDSFEHLAMLPYWDKPFPYISIAAVVLMVVACVIGVFFSCKKQLKIMPALILRGSSEKKSSKHVFLEKRELFWEKLSYETRFTVRNVLNNKVRSVMGIIGVLGSIVLVLAGLGMKNSFDYTVEATYNDFYKYNTKIELSASDITGDELGLMDFYQYIEESSVEMKSDNADDAEQYVALITIVDEGEYVFVPGDEELTNVNDVDGLIISQKFAKTLDVQKGDTVYWRYPSGNWEKIKIGKIIKSSLPRVMFISSNAWEENGQDFVATSILTSAGVKDIKIEDNSDTKVTTIESQSDSMQKVCDSSKSIVYILIFAAILLVLVVLTSLGILNFTEMYREYATLKVIGLYPGEIAKLAFNENLILTLIGWLLGIPCAYEFVNVYMDMLSNDTIVCLPNIEPISFVISSAIILTCSLGVNLILGRKLESIDMVASLKSNE